MGFIAILKRLVTAVMLQGDASGEAVSCLPGTQPAPWRAGMQYGRTRRGVGWGRQGWDSMGSGGELMPAPSTGHGEKDSASGTQKDLHGAGWNLQEDVRKKDNTRANSVLLRRDSEYHLVDHYQA